MMKPLLAGFLRMTEPKELSAARIRLARAEADYASPKSLDDLLSALALLDDVVDSTCTSARLAQRLALTYATKLCDHIRRLLQQDPHVPEPQLEHFFKMLRAFDDSIIELPGEASELKVTLARRLIECYLEGHTEERKAEALKQLLDIATQ